MSRTVYTPPSIVKTKGDLWAFSTLDVPMPVGADGLVLTADSTQALGLIFANAFGAGVNIWAGILHTDASNNVGSVTTFRADAGLPTGFGWQKGTAGTFFTTWGSSAIPKTIMMAMADEYLATAGSGNGFYKVRQTKTGSPTFNLVLQTGLESNVGGNLTFTPTDDQVLNDIPFFIILFP